MFSKEYLDELISPSQWSKIPSEDRIKNHIDFIEKHSKIVTDSIPNKLNIPYGTRPREVIHIYGTDLPKDSPIFIHVHGGFWQLQIIKHNSNTFMAKNLYTNQVKSIFVGYELCPDVTLEEILHNVQKALRVCLNYAKENEVRRICVSGHSAGAHIVAMLFQTFIPNLPEEEQSLFKTAFLLAGVYDVVSVLNTEVNDLLKLDEKTAIKISPLHQDLVAKYCELVIVVAKYDSPKLIQQGEDMYKYAKRLGLKAEYVFIRNMDHFDVVEAFYDDDNEMTKLVVKYCTVRD